jgi:hypothetical protein
VSIVNIFHSLWTYSLIIGVTQLLHNIFDLGYCYFTQLLLGCYTVKTFHLESRKVFQLAEWLWTQFQLPLTKAVTVAIHFLLHSSCIHFDISGFHLLTALIQECLVDIVIVQLWLVKWSLWEKEVWHPSFSVQWSAFRFQS